jgi:hypothetical protein
VPRTVCVKGLRRSQRPTDRGLDDIGYGFTFFVLHEIEEKSKHCLIADISDISCPRGRMNI